MRKISMFFLLAIVLLYVPIFGFAQRQGVGLGIIVGEPTGISIKNWFDSSTALDIAAAWSFGDYEAFQFHVDYLFHHPRYVESRLPFYYGLGGRFKLKDESGHTGKDDDDRIGLRFPLGLTYLPRTTPLDLFFEIVPVLDLAPETDVNFNAALGVRFYLQ